MIFQVQSGSFQWPKGPSVLKDVDFSVSKGQVVAVLGPNGAGKTTLLRCALGLLPWTSGQTSLNDRPLSSFSSRELWQHVAYVPQARHSAFALSVEEMVLLGRSAHLDLTGQPGKSDRKAAMTALERVGMAHRRKSRYDRLSGGELQLVLIARALCADPQLLVLDEPESNLDFRNQLMVLQIMESLAHDGLACLFNTHYPAHALRWAQNSLLLDRHGRSVFGPTEEVMTDASLQKLFGVRVGMGRLTEESCTGTYVVPLELVSSSKKE